MSILKILNKSTYFFILFLLPLCYVIIQTSCNNIPTVDDIEDEIKEGVYAVPLVNDTLKITDLLANGGNAQYSTDYSGKVSISFQGDVLTEDADIIAPPAVGFGDVEIPDTNFMLNFSGGSSNVIDSAVIKEDKILFKYVSIINKELKVRVWVEELTKDGEHLSEEIIIPPANGEKLEITGNIIDMEGYVLKGSNSTLTFKYDARTPDGTRVKLTRLYANFNLLRFDYIQGYFRRKVRPAEGSFIPVGLYDNWIAGSMEFKDPKISINVENGFGFPVGARFNSMSLLTLEDEVYELESQQLQDGIQFNYPNLDEVGEVKNTEFYFDNNNSNLSQLFQHRIKEVRYDIDAIANPDDIPDLLGFMNSDSYYKVALNVDIPMQLVLKNLTVQDTIEFSIDQENDIIDTTQLKLVFENTFPFDIAGSFYFLNEQGEPIDSLLDGEEIVIKGADVNIASGEVNEINKSIHYISYSHDRIETLLNTKNIRARVRLNSQEDYPEPIWLYDHYGLVIKAGAKIKFK